MSQPATPPEHLSIGEVLATLRDEFPDITISKIRFLESQGLIDPERTPSGYRKFYSPDIARLRWILHQQKENFLPLKVIKGRLEDAAPGMLPANLDPEPTAARRSTSAPAPTGARARAGTKGAPQSGKPARRARKARTETPPLPLEDGPDDVLDPGAGDAKLTRAQLGASAGLSRAQLIELEEYGLLEPAAGSGDKVLFDEDALAIAQLAAAFAKHGVQARHLRMYRGFAEREATLYGQLVTPVLRQRNPEARARAREDLVELAQLGRGLRTAFLRGLVGDLLTD